MEVLGPWGGGVVLNGCGGGEIMVFAPTSIQFAYSVPKAMFIFWSLFMHAPRASHSFLLLNPVSKRMVT